MLRFVGLLIVALTWGCSEARPMCDVNGDGLVDSEDKRQIVGEFLQDQVTVNHVREWEECYLQHAPAV